MKNELHIKFGKRVRELRKERGWSQEEFADRCGLDRTYVSGIERGVRNPTLEIIGMISAGLNVEICVLFHWTSWINNIILTNGCVDHVNNIMQMKLYFLK